MKTSRQQAILDIIRSHAVNKQDELLTHLRSLGFQVTQATVSRDIREMGLVKKTDSGGVYRYMLPEQDSGDKKRPSNMFETIFRQSVIKVDYAGNTVLVKCLSGMANACCEVFDSVSWNDVVGTLSGDDTFFILMRTELAAKSICVQLEAFTESKK